MTTPKRVQRKRTAGWRKPEGALYVGRGTRWGNPYTVVRQGDGLCGIPAAGDDYGWPTFDIERDARAEAANLYRCWLTERPAWAEAARRELAGKDLMCWCPEDQPCHADVLLAIANGGGPRG